MKIKAHKTVKDETVDEIYESILIRRIKTNREEFLSPPHPDKIDLSQLFTSTKKLKADLKKLFDLIDTCKKQDKTIIVYGDYDADGVTATAIMWETLQFLGFRTLPFIPERKQHGYGLSKMAIDQIKDKYDPGLIITVDCGITAHQEAKYAKYKNVPLVITDHHAASDKKLPPADVVFHSLLVSGSGMSFFISREILNHYLVDDKKAGLHRISDHVVLATVGSIADLVDIGGITRSIVKHGLEMINKSPRHGLSLIIQDKKDLNAFDIGFGVSPTINVFGRIADPMDALRLLCTNDRQRAKSLHDKSIELISSRRQLVSNALKNYDNLKMNDAIVAIVSVDMEEGIIGLVASDCVKKFGKPALIMCKSGSYYKGSMRSVVGVDCAKLLSQVSDLTESAGGHMMAGGFLIKEENIDEFLRKANDHVKQLKNNKIDHMQVDVLLPHLLSTLELAHKISLMAPFGKGNELPLFASIIKVNKVIAMGKTQKHAKVVTNQDSISTEFIFFNGYDIAKEFIDHDVVVVYQLEVDRWGGTEKASRKVVSIIPA